MSEKQFYVTSNQMIAILLDVFGIILVLVGATIARAHSGTGLGVILYWVGFVLPSCGSDRICVEHEKTDSGKGVAKTY